MVSGNKTQNILLSHLRDYPMLQLEDILKFLHQSSFGCEHMVTNLHNAIDRIKAEHNGISRNISTTIENLDGDYSRVHLNSIDKGLSPETLGKLFFASAKTEEKGHNSLEEKIEITRKMIQDKLLPFSINDFDKKVEFWRLKKFEALHHSDTFRNIYNPSYRVISNKYVQFLPLFIELDKALVKDRVIIAIEGGSASGKTTLSEILEEIYDCTVFHTDDFFLQPHQRRAERYYETGGNLDYERFYAEVIVPLNENKSINYRRFDCATMQLLPSDEILPQKLTVIEGAYSMHPYFGDYFDLSVYLDISRDLQKVRILNRNSAELAERFFNEWIPLEQKYFSEFKIKQRCDIVITAES